MSDFLVFGLLGAPVVLLVFGLGSGLFLAYCRIFDFRG